MTRVVRVNGEFLVQAEKRLNGRGAHVCTACLSHPSLSKALARSFKAQIPNSVVTQLTQK